MLTEPALYLIYELADKDRHTIRPVLAGTVPVLRLCPGVPVSQPKNPGYALNQPA